VWATTPQSGTKHPAQTRTGTKRLTQAPSPRRTGNSNVRELRPKAKKKIRFNYGRIAMLAVFVYFVIWTIYPLSHRIEQGRELQKLQKQLNTIQSENTQLSQQVKYLRSDEFVEQKARDLGLSKPDEEVVVVVPEDLKATQKGNNQSSQKSGAIAQPSLWQRLTGFFSNVL
jgi:cell division protein FtsB